MLISQQSLHRSCEYRSIFSKFNTLFLSIPFFISPILETSDISLTRSHGYIFLLLLQKFFSRLEYRDHYDDLPLKSLLAFFPMLFNFSHFIIKFFFYCLATNFSLIRFNFERKHLKYSYSCSSTNSPLNSHCLSV